MKRFTLILSLLVAMVTTAMAQQSIKVSTETDPVYYVIASYNRGGYLTKAGVGESVTHVNLTDGSYWYFESAGDDGSVYFVNKLKDGDSKIYLGSDKKASTTAAKWYILPNGVNNKGMSISSTNPISGSSCVDANNSNTGVGSWSPSASDWHGTTWVFVDYVDETYNPENLILRSRSDRYVETISLGEESATIDRDYAGDYGRAYFDLTKSVTFEVYAGQEVTPAITRDGSWTNAYAYIDLAGDGFTASVGENGAPGDDLVSYSFYSGDEADDTEGINSIGESLSAGARSTIAMPSFTAPSEPGTYRMRFKHDWNSINPNGSNANFMSNGGSIIDVTLIVTATINYSYQFNGVEKFTQTSTGYVGDEYPALSETAKFPYGITATKPAGLIEESDITDGVINKVIELTSTLPFVYAASYETITNWYYVKNKGEFYLSHVENQGYIALGNEQKTVDAGNKDAFSWAFVGNPFDGFQLVNKAAGEGYVLSSSTTIDGDGANTFPVMTLSPVNEGNNELWVLTASSHQENGFFIAQKGYANNRMNNRGNKLAYWTGGADNGSTFTVELRNDEAELLAALAEAQELVNSITGEGVGYATSASIKAVQDAIDAEDLAALQNAVAAIETIQPTEGKFYTIASASEQNGDSRTGKMIYVNADGGMKFDVADNTNLGYLFQFEAAGEGQFYMYNVAKDRYLNTANAHGAGQEKSLAEETTGAKKVTIANLGRENVVGLWPEGGAMIHAQTDNSVVVAWDNEENNNGSAWRIVEVEDPTTTSFDLTIGEAGYATLYLGCAVTIPEGVEAYIVNATNSTHAIMEKVDAIPAHTGVIITGAEGEAATAATYQFNYAASATAVESNLLKGTTIDTYIAGPAYVLGYINVAEEGEEERREVGLYMAALNADATGAATGETHFKNNANKAYLVVPGASEVASYSFRFGEDTTGIDEITDNRVQSTVIFDLTGRRVENISAPGIYIVGGKKVLVK